MNPHSRGSRPLVGLTLAVGMVVLVGTVSSFASKPNDVSVFMRAKLEHSQKLLEGLALEDFEMIAQQSQDLSLLSQATNWQVLQTEEYLKQSGEFRRTADALTEAAREKNLDGAALRFMDLTMKCVSCHKYVRKVRLAAVPQAPLELSKLKQLGGGRTLTAVPQRLNFAAP